MNMNMSTSREELIEDIGANTNVLIKHLERNGISPKEIERVTLGAVDYIESESQKFAPNCVALQFDIFNTVAMVIMHIILKQQSKIISAIAEWNGVPRSTVEDEFMMNSIVEYTKNDKE